MTTQKIYKTLAIAPLVIMALALIFRATVYWSFSVPDGEPKGGGDLLEVILFLILVGTCFLSILYAALIAVIPKLRNQKHSINLLIIGIFVPLVFWCLHPLIPRLV